MSNARDEQKEQLHKEWAEQIAECESSNMPVKEWCAAKGLNPNTFYGRVAAIKKEKNKQVQRDIVPLSTAKPKQVDYSRCKFVPASERVLIRMEDIEVIIPPDISVEMILVILRGLREC